MDYASRELCEELYKLSGWKSSHHFHQDGGVYECNNKPDDNVSAYDAGFLLRKLPEGILLDKPRFHGGRYEARAHIRDNDPQFFKQEADTPENALAKLAIELFKSGVLKKGIGDE